MRHFRWALLGCTFLVASQCTSGEQLSRGERHFFRGHVVIGEGVHVFIPCGSKQALWLDADNKVFDRLFTEHTEMSPVPYDYEGTYAELEGAIGPQLDCGFCEDYEGSFRVAKVLLHRLASAADCL